MRATIAVALLFSLLIAAAQAQVWIMSPSGGGGVSRSAAPPPVSCPSTGIFNLSNVCNDIYFIGALK